MSSNIGKKVGRKTPPIQDEWRATKNKLVWYGPNAPLHLFFIYPDAGSDEIYAFIVANGGMVYSIQDILKRCAEL